MAVLEDMPLNAADLLPCPFCGGEAEVIRRDVEPQGDPWYGKNMCTFVACRGCGCCLFDCYFHEAFVDAESAIKHWNMRSPAVNSQDGTGVERR